MDQAHSTTEAPAEPKNQDQDKSVLDKAKQAVSDGKVSDVLNKVKVPDSLKNAGNKVATSFNGLSTTQKVVGGTLLAAGIAYLAGGKKRKGRKEAAVLDELMLFVNDRIEGYKRAVSESKDQQLRSYYQQLVTQSQHFASTLNNYLSQHGGERETGTTLKGKLYRGWMDAKAAVTGRDEKSILESNIYGEEWAQKAYHDALDKKCLSGRMRDAVERQCEQSKQTYYRLKQLASQQQ